MDTSKSAKRVAKVAKQSAKTKVRAQRGLLFPVTMAVVILFGAFLVVYARQYKPAVASTTPPTLQDTWRLSYGVYVCNEFKPAFAATADPTTVSAYTEGDGLLVVHPLTASAAGKNAKLGLFLKTVGVSVSGDKITLPGDGGSYTNAVDKCDGKDATWKLAYWADAHQSGAPTIYVTDFENIRLTQDRGAVTLAFVAGDTEVASLKPTSIAALDALDAQSATTTTVDPNAPTTTVDPNAPTTTTVAGATTVATATTVAPTATATSTAAATTTTSG